MKNNRSLSVSMTRLETLWGWIYLIFELLALPYVLELANSLLKLSAAELNFTYHLINFLSVLWIFHSYLSRNIQQAKNHPAYLCQAVILGLASYYAVSTLVTRIIFQVNPGFINANDANIRTMASGSFFLVAVETVVLAPLAEECLFRGLIFRELYGKSRIAAYCVSIAAFAAIHISGYIGVYSPMGLLLSFLQYLPAGLSLAWAYAKSDTVFAPVLIHTIINAAAIASMR